MEQDKKYIEKGPSDCWPWIGNPSDAPHRDYLLACRNRTCCNPRHIVNTCLPGNDNEEQEGEEQEENVNGEKVENEIINDMEEPITTSEKNEVKRGRGRPPKLLSEG